MAFNALPLLGLAGLGALLLARSDKTEREAPKAHPRPGQPTPGAKSPKVGIPSIPAPPNAAKEPQIDPAILARMTAALATYDPGTIRRLASELEREGHPLQASELRAAADAIEAMRPPPPPKRTKSGTVVPTPTPSVPPFVPPEVRGVEPPKPPPLISLPPITVTKPEPILVTMPPPGAVPVKIPTLTPKPPVKAQPPKARYPRGAIPDLSTLTGKTALMLWESAPAGPVRDPELLAAYKKAVGLKQTDLYGPGTAQSLMGKGIVPPTPWDWAASASARRDQAKKLQGQYKYKATQDKARGEEWLQAAEDLNRYTG